MNPFADGINNNSSIFTIKNISTKKVINVFGIKLLPGYSYNLMNIEGISENDIKISLTKGLLKRKINAGEINIIACDLDLTTFNSTQLSILNSNGLINNSNNLLPISETIKIMVCGDSQTAGGATAMNDETLAYRESLWETLKSRRDYIQFIGPQISGLQLLSGSNLPGNIKLGDWHYCALGGYTIQQIDGLASTYESSYGSADYYTLLGGENNINIGESASTILSRIYTFCQNRISANPNCIIFVSTLVPHGPPLSYALYDAVSNAVNSQLSSYLAPLIKNVQVVNAGGALTKAHLNSTGNHPNGQGFKLIGRILGEAILRKIQVTGLQRDRRLIYRLATPKLSLTDDISSIASIADNGLIGPIGDSSFSFGCFFTPTDLSQAYQRRIVSIGPALAADKKSINLLYGPPYGGYGSMASLQLYIGNNAFFVHNDSLRLNKTHAIVCSIDKIKREAFIYCLRDGYGQIFGPVTSCVSAAPAPGPYDFTTGTINFGWATQRGAVGYITNFWCAQNYVATIDDAEQMYLDGSIPKQTTAYYPLTDGSGSVLAPSSGYSGILPNGSLSGTSWSSAGAINYPWDRYQDS